MELSGKAPPQTVREIIEGVSGLRVARVTASMEGLNQIDDLRSRFGFGASLGSFRVSRPLKKTFGVWSDDIGQRSQLANPNGGDFFIYLADVHEMAEAAREFDEEGNNCEFGRLLQIPSCCRQNYDALLQRDQRPDYRFTFQSSGLYHELYPENNLMAKYFGWGFLSHFPCSPECRETARVCKQRRALLAEVDIELSEVLMSGMHKSFLIEGNNIFAFEASKLNNGSVDFLNCTHGTSGRIRTGNNLSFKYNKKEYFCFGSGLPLAVAIL